MGRKLGQVFLSNYSVVDEIIDKLNPGPEDIIIEIGPGKGVLTDPISRFDCNLKAVELDKNLYIKLKKKHEKNSKVEIINADILNVSINEIVEAVSPEKVKVVGNIPYYITAPIITHLIDYKEYYNFALIMMQYEVGERILATPNSRKYGALTLFVQYNMFVEEVLKVPKEDFTPPPKVDSIILKFIPRIKPKVKVKNEKLLFRLINIAFQKRRKMIRNSLSEINLWDDKLILDEILKKAEIKETDRAENLSLEDFANICNIIDNIIE